MPFGHHKLEQIKNVEQKTVEMLAQGVPASQIAKQFHVTRNTVNKFKKRNKEKIEEEAQKYLDALPDLVQHDIDEINDYYEISQNLRTELKNETSKYNLKALQDYCSYVDKRITDIKKSIGLYSSNNPGLVFQQLNVFSNKTSELAPIISKLLGQANINQNPDDEEIIDVNALEEKENE